MDLNAALAKIAELDAVIAWLVVTVLGLIAYILGQPILDAALRTRSERADPTCPLHKLPRSRCRPEWHEEE